MIVSVVVESYLKDVHKQNQQAISTGVKTIPNGTHTRDDEQVSITAYHFAKFNSSNGVHNFMFGSEILIA